jgi:hypothetical protein
MHFTTQSSNENNLEVITILHVEVDKWFDTINNRYQPDDPVQMAIFFSLNIRTYEVGNDSWNTCTF